MAYSTRTAKLADTIKNNPNCKIIICERSLEADNNVFAKMLKDSNNMEEVEYQIYEHFYNTRKQDMNLDAVIYIDASPNVCLQRIKKEIEMEKRVLLVIICNHVKIIMTTGYSIISPI